MMFRIGLGTDIHRLTSGKKLVIGGIEISSEKGSEAHSDGDVLIHALCDALLGALAKGDIGTHFPDSDPQWRNADSELFLDHCINLVLNDNWGIVNIDAVIQLELPKLRPYIREMREQIARICQCKAEQVSIKAKTHEGCDSIGQGESIAAQVIVLLQK